MTGDTDVSVRSEHRMLGSMAGRQRLGREIAESVLGARFNAATEEVRAD